MIKLSIIIPVYNMAIYLSECLESILDQNEQNIEVICINDGSSDNSLEILTEFAEKDNRIVIINQENQGVSVARNAGLIVAKGEYIGFVDSDDTIAADYFEIFLNTAKEDIISTSLGSETSLQENKVYGKNEIQHKIYPLMLSSDVLNSCCTKVFKNEIILQHQLRFPVGVSLGEDAHFISQYLQYAQSFKYIKNHGYFYRENEDSATRAVKDDGFFSRIFEVYQFEHKDEFQLSLDQKLIKKWKSQRLIQAFIANLSLYLRKNAYLSYIDRKRIIKTYMIQLKNSGALDVLTEEDLNKTTNFEKLIFKTLKQQNYFKIYCLYKYSHWRNHIK